MNKKLFLGMFAAAGMLLATSCSNDELDMVQSGNEAQVTFSLAAEGGIATRAISDGKSADLLYYAIFDANKQLITTINGSTAGLLKKEQAFPNGSKEDNVEVTLAKGQEYTAVFWAQDASCNAYTVTAENDGLKVAVDYKDDENDNNNDETRDAFFKAETFTVTGNTEIPVVLKRPFAQINVGVTKADWDAAVESGVEITESKVVIKNVANKINLLDGTVSGQEVVTYDFATIPAKFTPVETLEVDINRDGAIQEEEKYVYLSMSYILTDNDADRTTLEADGLQFTFSPATGEDIVFDEGLHAVPVQRNWRTNILGKILTGDIQFNIEIDQRFVDDYNLMYPDKDDNSTSVFNVTNVTELQDALNNATDGAVIYFANDITGDVTATQKPNVKISILGQGYSLEGSITVDGKSQRYETAGITIKDVVFNAGTITTEACINLGVAGNTNTRYTSNVSVDGCTFDVPNAVGIKSYDGGDKNLTITGCTATANAHSLLQVNNVEENLIIKGCNVYSKNGINLNQTAKVEIENLTAAVKGYVVRFGASSGGSGAAEVYSIKNSSLKTDNSDGDAVIILRGTADNSTLTIENTTIEGDEQINNTATNATVIIDGVATVSTANSLLAVINMGVTTVKLADGEYDMPNLPTVNGVKLIGESRENTKIKLYNTTSGGDFCLANSTATLENMTIITEIKDWAGFQNAADLTFNKCDFVNNLFLSGDATFNECHFTVTTNHYNVWAYSANSRNYTATFNTCVFDCAGKSIYIDGNAGGSTTMNFTGCTFNDNDGGATDKAAIETGTTYGAGATYNVNITGCTFDADGFAINPNGINTNSTIWANKNSMSADKLNIVIDGQEVY